MKKEKRKQIILMVLGFVFMGIGWFNFLHQNKSVEVAAEDSRDEFNLGDVQLVNSEASNVEEKEYLSEIVSNEEIENLENTQVNNIINETNISVSEELTNEEISTSISDKTTGDEFTEDQINNELNNENSNEYFVETKLQRDTMYSEMLETYQKMLENPEVGETQKVIATQEVTNITTTKNGIMIAENLIKNKGFENVVILANNGIVNVVVRSSLLNQEQIAKIQNIVSRELHVELQNINISKK